MITGEIQSQVNKIWVAFWTGGISNPLEMMEQITYLVVYEEVEHRAPQAILDEVDIIEKEITTGMKQLRGMLK